MEKHAKFVQITAVVNDGRTMLYALDEAGKVWEKIVINQGGTWTLITL